jgi:NitT/TauT family transport system ATP-binding protein
MSDGPIARLQGVAKTFGTGTVALRDFTADVRRGEIFTLLGPSGCGKSTVLRLIAGLARPDAGAIDVGVDRRDQGFVFQDPTLMPWTSVARNVWLPLRLRGIGWSEARADVEAALARVGLAGFGDAYPRELSGGMRMRVSIARALVTRPALLLMDEPFAALDEIVRFRLDDDLARLREESGTTIVFVTHSVFESVYLSDRIAILSARPGHVVETIVVDRQGLHGDAFRASPSYASQCARVSAASTRASGEVVA